MVDRYSGFTGTSSQSLDRYAAVVKTDSVGAQSIRIRSYSSSTSLISRERRRSLFCPGFFKETPVLDATDEVYLSTAIEFPMLVYRSICIRYGRLSSRRSRALLKNIPNRRLVRC